MSLFPMKPSKYSDSPSGFLLFIMFAVLAVCSWHNSHMADQEVAKAQIALFNCQNNIR